MAAICFDYPALVAQLTFTRGAEVLMVEYCGNMKIVLTYPGAAPQTLRFRDPVTAAFFQTDFERELLQDGWTFDISELSPPLETGAVHQRPAAQPA